MSILARGSALIMKEQGIQDRKTTKKGEKEKKNKKTKNYERDQQSRCKVSEE